MERHKRPMCRLIGFVLLASSFPLSVTAATDEVAAARYYEDAVVRFEAGDTDAAIIQLKNALQQYPEFLPALVLLGLAHVQAGHGAAAEDVLEKASRLGADRSLTAVPLAKAYLQQGKLQQLLDRIHSRGYPPQLQSEILVYRGLAHVELRQLADAEQAFKHAAQLDPEAAAPLVGEATVLLRRGDLGTAAKVAHKAVTLAPGDPDTWNVKASVSHAQGDLEQALTEYGKAIALQPRQVETRIARAGVLLDLGRDAEATSALKTLRKEFSNDPRAAYLYAVLLTRRGDQEGVKAALVEAASIVERLGPETFERRQQLLLLGGLVNYSLNQPEKARDYLTKYVQRQPSQPGARKLLGAVLLSTGEVNRAIAVLEPALRSVPRDYRLLGLLGNANMRAGRHVTATALLERAVELSKGSPETRTQLALGRLAAGEQDLAVQELDAVFGRQDSKSQVGVLLATIYLRQGDLTGALRVTSQLVEREPGNLTALNLLGSVQLAAGRRQAARASFEKALALDGGFLPARLNLGNLNRLEGRAEDARARYLAVLQESPDNAHAMVGMARLEDSLENTDEAVRWLEKARSTDADVLAARLYLAELYLRTGQTQSAMEVAQETQLRAPDNLEILGVVGRCHDALGRPDLAQITFRRMADLAGFDPRWLYRIARYQLAAGDDGNAIWSLQKAVKGDPDFLPAQTALIEVQLQHGSVDAAEERAQVLRARYPERTIGDRLMGDVMMRRGRYAGAAESYRAALARQASPRLAIRLYQALSLGGDREGAVQFLNHWVDTHPDDLRSKQALAEGHLRLGQLEAARLRYEQILAIRPDSPFILNNLAYIMARQGNPRALDVAQQAHQLAPEAASINDTLGWILVQQGQPARGLTYLRDAHYRISGDPEIRYHMAVALYQLGRRQQARAQLEEALKASQSFDDYPAARALLETLQREKPRARTGSG